MPPTDFEFELPEALIAQTPTETRAASRLLRLPAGGGHEDLAFTDLPGLLHAGDLLVVNDSRVVHARLFGLKPTGGRVELLLERILEPRIARVQLRSSHAPAEGARLTFEGENPARVLGRDGDFFILEFEQPVAELLEAHGHVPLPPYIRRADAPADRERYQTVYARRPGSVAAPTAGLHFDRPLLDALAERHVERASITLHVGAGTFAPVRPHHLANRRLHAEWLEVGPATVDAIGAARARGGRIIAVGTTTVRALETAAAQGELAPFTGETDIFITPGFRFRVVDALLTNFHLPGSSLLMLVCAFGATGRVLDAYRHAVRSRYRFFSYGDAMFLERTP